MLIKHVLGKERWQSPGVSQAVSIAHSVQKHRREKGKSGFLLKYPSGEGRGARGAPKGLDALLAGLKASVANPYLVLFCEGLPHLQATSWEQKGQPNAP